MQLVAGQLSHGLDQWQHIISDQNILNIVACNSMEFIDLPLEQISCAPNSICKDHFIMPI